MFLVIVCATLLTAGEFPGGISPKEGIFRKYPGGNFPGGIFLKS